MPVAMGPIEEYATVILVCPAAAPGQTTYKASKRISQRGEPIISTSAKTAAENLNAFGFLDVIRKLILILPRIGDTFGFFWAVFVEHLYASANKVRAGSGKRHLHLLAKLRHVFDRARAFNATTFGYSLQVHFRR